MGKSYRVVFEKKEKVAKDAYTFYFRRGDFPDFIPGQYLRLELPHKADDRGTTRYFTISSSPLNKKYLTITTRIIKSTFKKELLNLKPGTKVNVFGPMGWFVLPKDEKEEKVFIAGGIGVTPFRSLLTSIKDKQLEKPITLFAAFSNKENFVFYAELADIAKKNSEIEVVYTDLRISSDLINKYIADIQKPIFLVTGPPAMVEEIKKLLLDLGAIDEKIQTEDFDGY